MVQIPDRPPTDWKALIAATALFCTGLYFAGTVYSERILDAVDKRIVAHSNEAAIRRAAFFDKLEAKADSAIARLGAMEAGCTVFREWRPSADAFIRELQAGNVALLQRVATLESIATANAKEHARTERRVDKLDDRRGAP